MQMSWYIFGTIIYSTKRIKIQCITLAVKDSGLNQVILRSVYWLMADTDIISHLEVVRATPCTDISTTLILKYFNKNSHACIQRI